MLVFSSFIKHWLIKTLGLHTFLSSILGSFTSYLNYWSVSWCVQVCVYMWSMQQCVLVSPGESIVSPCFQFLMIVEMRISHTLFLFGDCFCSLFIDLWGTFSWFKSKINREEGSKQGERSNLDVKAVLTFFSEQLCASGI